MLSYKHYFYGSEDSTDTDVIISIPKSDMPEHQEDRKRMVKRLVTENELDWNATLVVIEDGYLVDTIYPKAWVDSLNNALWNTYANHQQEYPNPLKGELKRHLLLAIYKTARTVLAAITRTHYRTTVRPIIKGIHDFNLKIKALEQIDFTTITNFNQRNAGDIDLWKTLAFYLGQNLSLVNENHEIYSKNGLVAKHPDLYPFIYRQPLSKTDIDRLNDYLKTWLEMVKAFGPYNSEKSTLSCREECIDMQNEVIL